jgi:predicted kinase
VISLDRLRDDLGVDPSSTQGPVVAEARERARVLLRSRTPFVWNATNLGYDRRRGIIDLCADYKTKVSIVYLEAPEAELERRNAARERPVPRAALERMLDHWQPPDSTECHNLDIVLG